MAEHEFHLTAGHFIRQATVWCDNFPSKFIGLQHEVLINGNA